MSSAQSCSSGELRVSLLAVLNPDEEPTMQQRALLAAASAAPDQSNDEAIAIALAKEAYPEDEEDGEVLPLRPSPVGSTSSRTRHH